MLSANTCEKILRSAINSKYSGFELYASIRTRKQLDVEHRVASASSASAAGLMLRAIKDGSPVEISLSDLDLTRALSLLDLANSETADLTSELVEALPLREPPFQAECVKRLTRWAGDLSVRYAEETHQYFVLHGDLGRGTGDEEFAELNWPTGKRVSANIEEFWKTWKPEVTSEAPKLWPAPRGRINILWTPQALARLLTPFFRHFESDLVLENRSMLTKIEFPQPFRFDLFDDGWGSTDHQGVQVAPTTLFQDFRPRRLVCNRRTAAELGVPPTGHARRSGYLVNSTIGFWHLRLVGHERVDNARTTLGDGIEVFDAYYDDDEKVLTIVSARLIHQGEMGEAIEETRLEVPIHELLASLKVFSETTESVGLEFFKGQNHMVTQCRIPWGISTDLPSPGTGNYSPLP